MPKPPPRSYDPKALGADCQHCPLRCKDMLPVPPRRPVTKAKAIIIIESPDSQSKYKGVAMQGNASKLLDSDLESFGLSPSSTAVIHRIACCPPKDKRTDSLLRKAASACQKRVLAELQRLDSGNRLPRLYLGKWAPIGIMGQREYKEALEIKMSRSVVRRSSMVLSHPTLAYFNKPALRRAYRTDLSRFADYVNEKLVWPAWPENLIITPSVEMLRAIQTMGPTVATDAETLGVDPLTAPITAIGISDGVKTVSIPWCSYDNRFGYHQGIEDSQTELAMQIKRAVKDCLENRLVIGQNITYDLLSYQKLGIEIRRTEDTMDASKILDPEIPAGLEDLAARCFPLPSRWKTEFRAGRDDDAKGADEFREAPQEHLLTYNAKDTLTTAWIWPILAKRLATED